MATKYQVKGIPQLETEISEKKSQLKAMPNYYTATGKDGVKLQTSFERLKGQMEDLENQRQIARWYGDKEKGTSEGPKGMGPIGETLDFITKPLYGVVGAAKHTLGQGKGSLWQDTVDNMERDKDTFGNVLQNSGLTRGVAAPLGFALDIFFDPVNWATMGTSAFIPRIGVGAVKGLKEGQVIKGIATAGKSGILEKTTTLGRFTPFFRKSKAFEKLGEKSMASTVAWEEFSGKTAANMLMTTGKQGRYQQSFKELTKRALEENPKAAKFVEHFVYDPIEWVKQARVKDIMQRSLGHETDLKGVLNAAKKGESIEPFLAREKSLVREEMQSMPGKKSTNPFEISENIEAPTNLVSEVEVNKTLSELEALGYRKEVAAMERASGALVKDADDAVSLANDTKGTFTTLDGIENESRLLADAVAEVNNKIGGKRISLDEITNIVTSGAMDNTGVKWFDNMMDGIKNYAVKIDRAGAKKTVAIGKKTMEKYDIGMAIFRVAKVAASPTAWVNAVAGNLIMTHMAGGSIGPKFLQRLRQVKAALYSSNAEGRIAVDKLLREAGGDSDYVRKFLAENWTGAHGTFGDLSFLGDIKTGRKGLSEYTEEIIMKNANDMGIQVGSTGRKQIKEAIAEIRMKQELAKETAQKTAKLEEKLAGAKAEREVADVLSPPRSNAAYTKNLIKEKGFENVSDLERGGGMMANELYNSRAAMEVFDFVAKKAKDNPNNFAYTTLNSIFNKAPEAYEKIDQTFKLTTFLTATKDGYSYNELKRLAKFVEILPEEVNMIKEAGQVRYTLHPRTAMELANVLYLNYAAMPAAVKILRNFPIISSPFISFSYGMAIKTGQTMAYNPAAFNKVGFAMKEFGGQQTPLEKQVLETDKYSYLNEPGMMRLPFFKENPVYMNMASMVPYYSLNMFNPSGASYGNSVREKLVSGVQSSPFLKNPVGSLLFDYMIQPLILDEATRPQGQFGQALYPTDANFLEKTGYGLRSFGETFVPNVTAIAGLLTPEAAAEFIPSYRWRELARAKYGKNALGVRGKEPVMERSVRSTAKYLGLPIQSAVDTTYVDQNKK